MKGTQKKKRDKKNGGKKAGTLYDKRIHKHIKAHQCRNELTEFQFAMHRARESMIVESL